MKSTEFDCGDIYNEETGRRFSIWRHNAELGEFTKVDRVFGEQDNNNVRTDVRAEVWERSDGETYLWFATVRTDISDDLPHPISGDSRLVLTDGIALELAEQGILKI